MTVSTGIRNILNDAAKKLETRVLIDVFKSLVDLFEFIKAMTPVFENVSPNLDRGPYSKAGINPL